jgi:hypothetical protein
MLLVHKIQLKPNQEQEKYLEIGTSRKISKLVEEVGD